MPEGYRGVVVREEKVGKSEKGKNEGEKRRMEEDEEEEEDEEDALAVGTLEEIAEFEEVIVWDHEAIPSGDDAFVKGMEEWIRFAEVVSLTCMVFFFLGGGGFGVGWMILMIATYADT